MPIDPQALKEFIGTVRGDQAKFGSNARKAAQMQRVIGATGQGTQARGDLVEALTGMSSIGADPAKNRFRGTRTAEMFRGLLSDEEVSSLLNGEGGPEVGLQNIAALLYERLGKMGVGEKARGEFLGDVMNRFEANLSGRK